jgi:hypothetical protein
MEAGWSSLLNLKECVASSKILRRSSAITAEEPGDATPDVGFPEINTRFRGRFVRSLAALEAENCAHLAELLFRKEVLESSDSDTI